MNEKAVSVHTNDTMNVVLPTLPSHADIEDISETLRSGKFYVIITRMIGPTLDIMSTLIAKYYTPNENDDFMQKIFPSDEGITYEVVKSRTKSNMCKQSKNVY